MKLISKKWLCLPVLCLTLFLPILATAKRGSSAPADENLAVIFGEAGPCHAAAASIVHAAFHAALGPKPAEHPSL